MELMVFFSISAKKALGEEALHYDIEYCIKTRHEHLYNYAIGISIQNFILNL